MNRGTSQTIKRAAFRSGLLKAAVSVPSASSVIEASFKEDAKVQRAYSEHITAWTEKAMPNVIQR
ncbi:MAG TPA: hypothetical protein VE778_03820 [Candidatus Bathyarchaeia archaeon]|jgi:hypothetical protein|nr:hypothetical protein [Candidatus Bathyarchaeia archaeon]